MLKGIPVLTHVLVATVTVSTSTDKVTVATAPVDMKGTRTSRMDAQILTSALTMLLTHALEYAQIHRGISLVHAREENK